MSTAFRWRHLLLDYVREGESILLRDRVEVRATHCLYSNKGQRSREARNLRGAAVTILWARDERGASVGEHYITWDFNAQVWAYILLSRLDEACTIAAPGGHLGSIALLCRRHRLKWEPQTYQDLRASALTRQIGGCYRWLKRFRGVATSYLDNYMAWYRMIGGNGELHVFRRWFIAALPRPTIPANTG